MAWRCSWMCMRCLGTPANFKWPGEHIYIGHQLKRAVTSRWPVFCIGIGTSDHRASEHPVSLSNWTSRWTSWQVCRAIGSSDHRASVQPVSHSNLTSRWTSLFCWCHCSDAPPVQPVLKAWLLRNLHHLWNTVHWLHRCPFLDCRFNRCFTWSLHDL